jgi:hypothetical protein
MRRTLDPVKELPSIYCHKCRRWIESQEKVQMFASVDGKTTRPALWTCPECRGEAEVAVEAHAPVTQGDIARDERLGPYRAVKASTVKLNPSGKTARATLECGHEACVVPNATKTRCRKCRAKRGE